MKFKSIQKPTLLAVAALLFATPALAQYRPIIRAFHSARTAGMGDVRVTTGMYEEALFGNPARLTAIEGTRFQLPKFTFEVSSAALGAMGDLLSSDGGLSAASGSVGKPISARFQMMLPAYYSGNFTSDQWALGVGFLFAGSTTAVVSQTGYVDPNTLINVGPAFTLSRRLLDENRLSVGATLHTQFRASSNSFFSIRDFLSGRAISSFLSGGSGLGIDLDLGSTFRPHWKTFGMDYELGLSINNVFGGRYTNLGGKITTWPGDPMPSLRSFGFGISAKRKDWGPFAQVLFAIEMTDIGNNPKGSLFRNLHLGTEALWKKLALRTGLNQGYLTGGLGMDLSWFTFNLATYGEELGLTTGVMEDRRYALEFGFHI